MNLEAVKLGTLVHAMSKNLDAIEPLKSWFSITDEIHGICYCYAVTSKYGRKRMRAASLVHGTLAQCLSLRYQRFRVDFDTILRRSK